MRTLKKVFQLAANCQAREFLYEEAGGMRGKRNQSMKFYSASSKAEDDVELSGNSWSRTDARVWGDCSVLIYEHSLCTTLYSSSTKSRHLHHALL